MIYEKMTHQNSEKRRRETLKETLDILKRLCPENEQKKSKANIIDSATRYMQKLKFICLEQNFPKQN